MGNTTISDPYKINNYVAVSKNNPTLKETTSYSQADIFITNENIKNDDEAFNAYNSGNYKRALELYQKLAAETKLAAFYYNLGASLYCYAKTINNKQTRVKTLLEAETAYRQALKINPKHIKAYNNLGVVYDILRKLNTDNTFKSKEKEHYQSALNINPDYGKANFNMALLNYEEKNYSSMYQHIEKALADQDLDPQSRTKCFYFLGVYEFQKQNYLASSENFSEALGKGLDPNFRELKYYLDELSRLLYSKKNTQPVKSSKEKDQNKELESIDKVLAAKNSPASPEELYSSGLQAYDKKQYGKALNSFQKALDCGYDKKDHGIWLFIGFSYFELGLHKKAITAFDRAIDLGYRDGNIYYCRAYSYYTTQIEQPKRSAT